MNINEKVKIGKNQKIQVFCFFWEFFSHTKI